MGAPLPVSSLIVEDWFNGIYTALVFVTCTLILINGKKSLRQRSWLLGWVIVPYICSTIHCSLDWLYFSKAVDGNELPGGPGLLFSLTHLPVWLEGVGDTFFCLNILLADCSFIWRCWIIWGRRWIVIVLPMMATVTGVVLAGMIISDQVTALSTKEAFTVAKKSAEFVTLSTAYFSMSIATSLTTAALITARVLYVQRALRRSGKAIIEIVVESAVLYSITLLIFLVWDVPKNPNVFYAQNIHAQIAGIAPLLITLRIVAGYARPEEEWSNLGRSSDLEEVGSGSGKDSMMESKSL